MKKLAAILLLLLFVFNTIGYRFLLNYAQNIADKNLEAQLDKGAYNDADLMEVKIPLNLPYMTNWKDFERVDGEIDINGEEYKYVKRKVYNDTMILLCIRHDAKMQLQQKANDYFGKVNGMPANENSKKAEVFKQLSEFDYNENNKSLLSLKENISYNLVKHAAHMQQYLPVQEQPPDVI